MNNEEIKKKYDEIERLKTEIKELECEENRSKIESFRQKYVGRCYSGSLCEAIKIIDISIAADDWFQATYVAVTVPSKYFDTTYYSNREKNYQILPDVEIDIHCEPWLRIETENLDFDKNTGELLYGHKTTEEEFQMRVQFALNYIDKVSRMTTEECLEKFNKEDWGED